MQPRFTRESHNIYTDIQFWNAFGGLTNLSASLSKSFVPVHNTSIIPIFMKYFIHSEILVGYNVEESHRILHIS